MNCSVVRLWHENKLPLISCKPWQPAHISLQRYALCTNTSIFLEVSSLFFLEVFCSISGFSKPTKCSTSSFHAIMLLRLHHYANTVLKAISYINTDRCNRQSHPSHHAARLHFWCLLWTEGLCRLCWCILIGAKKKSHALNHMD